MWLTAALLAFNFVPSAGAAVGTLGFAVTVAAGAFGVGLLAGEWAAAHFHATRLGPADAAA